MTPLFLSAPRVMLVSTSCTAAAVNHDMWPKKERKGKKKKEKGTTGVAPRTEK
jgi:hypothetical protein